MDWLDQKQNLIEGKLKQLGLSSDRFNTENLISMKLVPDEVDSGMKKSFYGKFSDINKIFNSVIVQEYDDETKMVCLIKDDVSEKKICEIIDFFYDWFGLDSVLRGKMNHNDLIMVRENKNGIPLREWIFDDFLIRIRTDIDECLFMFWILGMKTCTRTKYYLI